MSRHNFKPDVSQVKVTEALLSTLHTLTLGVNRRLRRRLTSWNQSRQVKGKDDPNSNKS